MSKIAFVANVDGNWDVFTVNPDGSGLVRLTQTPYDENEPHWSQDRKNIVYSANDNKLHIINVESRDEYDLVIEDGGDKKMNPSFSPDGKKLVYVHFKPDVIDDTELVIFDLDKKTLRKLVDQHCPQFYPSWSPDGKHIIYANVHCSSECGRIIQELWMIDPKSNSARQVLMTNSHCMQPMWSPDNKKIVFCSDKSDNYDIWMLTLEDKNLKQLTNDPHLDTSPAFSPDGKKIAFISARTGKMKIWIKDLKTNKLKELNPFEDRKIECRDVAW